jgi:hypothetical protein
LQSDNGKSESAEALGTSEFRSAFLSVSYALPVGSCGELWRLAGLFDVFVVEAGSAYFSGVKPMEEVKQLYIIIWCVIVPYGYEGKNFAICIVAVNVDTNGAFCSINFF